MELRFKRGVKHKQETRQWLIIQEKYHTESGVMVTGSWLRLVGRESHYEKATSELSHQIIGRKSHVTIWEQGSQAERTNTKILG